MKNDIKQSSGNLIEHLLTWLDIFKLLFNITFIIIMPIIFIVGYFMDVPAAFHWLGHTGLLCQLAENILAIILVLDIWWSLCVFHKNLSHKKPKLFIEKTTANIFLSLVMCIIIGYCCYNMYYVVLDLTHPPITKTITIKNISHLGKNISKDSMHFIINGEMETFFMPYSIFFDWSVGPVPELNHIISYPREAELTYYPNTKTVNTIIIHEQK